MLRVRVIPAVVPQEALPAAEAVEEAAEAVPPAEAADTAFKKNTYGSIPGCMSGISVFLRDYL